MVKTNRIIAAIFIVFALFTFLWSFRFPEGSELWPQFFSVVLILLAIGLIFDTFKNPNREDESEGTITSSEYKVLGMIAVSILVYMTLLNIVGFSISTIFLIGGLLWYLGYRYLKKVVLISIVSSILITTIFQFLLNVPLPQGLFQNLF
ncbi:tripartite tricarboxylate transporter TctB family protein [Alkalihalophilus pseudofirmus]|uniref:Tripartite tricarboxylate transporter TctB family protein n=1 Tax=Alkalihalophilus pseudofirmus TaxID=79885 RepID=A0AAJ2NNB6_ALKPS|nr:tripartite tricarboxylate transporter TctB family protein [Alkalihalophilus pseudofirmus]MDV2885516.1 tripartite tricarboxylate transporter TctB family protein [Alkalihalophilus pseudofirmus]